jgi:hypothetical protein
MKRHLLILVTAVFLLFGGSAIGSSVASAPASVPGDGGGMVCNPDRIGVWGYLYNAGLGLWAWHTCTYGGAGSKGYWDWRYEAWVRTCAVCYGGDPWYTHRWHWAPNLPWLGP